MAASDIDELRQRVDLASSLLAAVGNVYRLADMLGSAAYNALCLGSDRDAKELLERAIPIARRLDDPTIWMLLRGNAGLAAVLTSGSAANWSICRTPPKACAGLQRSPRSATTSPALRGSSAPQPHIAMANHMRPSRHASTRPSSKRLARAMELMPGTQPPMKEAR